MDEPLIYTSMGNMPISLLSYSHKWEDLETCIKLTETYTFEGNIVKQACHVLMKKGNETKTELENF